MKKLSYLLLFSFSVLLFSCSKDEPKVSIEGYWVGKFDYMGFTDLPFAILAKKDKTLLVYVLEADTTQAMKAKGTYTFHNDNFTASFAYVNSPDNKFSAIATSESPYNILEGTFGQGNATSGAGKFSVTR